MALTNAQLAQQISEMVNYWRTRDLQFAAWLGGVADGGPYGDGRYPLTDYLGVTQYLYCPAALEAGVTNSASAAAAQAALAGASKDAALAAQAATEAARNLALTYRNEAQAARDLALTYRDEAANHKAIALTHRNNAAASATAAAGSAADADTSADAAANYAGDAASSASAAAAAAAAAAASAAAAATFNPADFYTKVASDARYLQLAGGTLTGQLTISPPVGAALQLKSPTADHIYLEFYADAQAQSTRSGWVGFGNAGSGTMSISNEMGSILDFNTLSGQRTRMDSNAAHVLTQVRASGWYGSSGALGGMGAEMGVSGGEAWFIAYNRNASSFGGVNLQGSRLRLLNASGTLIEHRDFGTGSSRQINIYGTTSTAYFYYGPNEDVYLRPGTGSGTVYMDYGAGVSIGRPVDINAGTSQPLSLTTTSGGPWHVSLARTDIGYTTRLRTNGQGVFFEHRPQFSGFHDLSGSGKVLLPSVSAQPYLFDFYSNHASISGIRLLDAGGTSRIVLYASGSTYGILDGPGNWRLQFNGSSTATFHGLDVQTTGDSFYAAGGYRWYNDSSFYIYNTSGYTYGSWRIGGVRGGYVGLVLDDFGKRPTFMSNNDAAGIYEQGISAWQYYCQSGLFRIGSSYKPYFDGGPGAILHHTGGQTSGRITLSTGAASGTPNNGDIWIQHAA